MKGVETVRQRRQVAGTRAQECEGVRMRACSRKNSVLFYVETRQNPSRRRRSLYTCTVPLCITTLDCAPRGQIVFSTLR